MPSKTNQALIFAILVLLLNVAFGLKDLNTYVFDEPDYVDASQAFLDHDTITNWEHPPLSKYFVAAGRSIFRNKVVGARAPSVLALLVLLVFLSLTVREIWPTWSGPGQLALWAPLLALTDPFMLNFSKLAEPEVYVVACIVAALFFSLKILRDPKWFWIAALSLTMGLAMAFKWSAGPVVGALFLTLYFYFRKRSPKLRRQLSGSAALAVAVYFMTYTPYLWIHDHDTNWLDVLRLQQSMWTYHLAFNVDTGLTSSWWQWPIFASPLWLTQDSSLGGRGLLAIGNFATYLAGPVGIGMWLWRERSVRTVLIAVGYLSTLLFWACMNRPTYFYYYLNCAPFLYLGVLYWMQWSAQSYKVVWPSMAVLIASAFALCLPYIRWIPVFFLLAMGPWTLAKEIITNEVVMSNAPEWLKQSRVEKITDRVQAKLEWSTRKVNVGWYFTPAEYEKVNSLGPLSIALTKTEGGQSSIHLGPLIDTKNFDEVFAHELVHVIAFQKYKSSIPKWLEEGLANHLAKAEKVDYKWLAARPFPSDVRELAHPFNGSAGGIIYRYKASQALAEMLDKKCGLENLIRLSVERNMEDYIKTYCEIDDLNAAFKAWVKKKS